MKKYQFPLAIILVTVGIVINNTSTTLWGVFLIIDLKYKFIN